MNGAHLRTIILNAIHGRQYDAARTVRFPATPKLLGESVKVSKGEKENVLTAVMYLAPATLSVRYGGSNVCPNATPGCIAACLGHSSGRLAMDSSRNAQIWKTLAFKYAREWFMHTLALEIQTHAARAARKGMACAVRLNGTSDIAWENEVLGLSKNLMQAFPDVQFYDYTKSAERAAAYGQGRLPPNYHLTFSLAETPENHTGAALAARAGCNVAAVFRTKNPENFPSTFLLLPVVNGDTTDIRFADPDGCVVGLTCKGNKAIHDKTGFVQEI